MKNIKHYGKIDHKTLHFLPFVPSRKRSRGYVLTREYGNSELTITALETLNTYDLLTLLYIVKEYTVHGYAAGYIGEGEDRREIAGIKLDVKKFLAMRGILNKKANRNTLKKSVMRLRTINLVFTNKQTGAERHTSYIYEFDVDKNIEEIKVYANKAFIDFIIRNGVLVNLERLKLYGDKEQYAILLDLYMQGTKIPYKHGGRTHYAYRNKFSHDEIEKALKLDLTDMRHADKLEKIRETFHLLHNKGKLPPYKYNKIERTWEKIP